MDQSDAPVANSQEAPEELLKQSPAPAQSVAVFLQVDASQLAGINDEVLARINSKAEEFQVVTAQLELSHVEQEAQQREGQQKLEEISEKQRLAEEKLAAEQNRALTLEKQLSTTRNTEQSQGEQVANLNAKCRQLIEDKQRALQALNRRSVDVEELKSELHDSQSKLLASRKSIVELENDNRQLHQKEASLELRVQSLEQELTLVQQNSQWLDTQLSQKVKELNECREEKFEQVRALRSQADSDKTEAATLRVSMGSLQTRYDSLVASRDEALVKVKQLTDAAAENEIRFSNEMDALDKLSKSWQKTAEDLKEQLKEEAEKSSKWRQQAETEKLRSDGLQVKLKNAESAVEAFNESVNTSFSNGNAGAPQTPHKDISKLSGGGMSGIFSPSAAIISEYSKKGSLVELYAEFQEAKARLAQEQAAKERLQEQLSTIVDELEIRGPEILQLSEDNKRMELDLADTSIQLESMTRDNQKLRADVRLAKQETKAANENVESLSYQVSDLSRQVKNLLVQQKLANNDESPLSAEESAQLRILLDGGSETQNLITERLVVFKDIFELQEKNANLLKVTRQLAQKMEEEEAATKRKLDDIEGVVISEAKEAIESLQNDVESLKKDLERITKERDMFRSMIKSQDGHEEGESSATSGKYDAGLAAKFEDFKKESAATIRTLNTEINSLVATRSKLQLALARAESQVELSKERTVLLKDNIESLKSENTELKRNSVGIQDALTKQDSRASQIAQELVATKSKLAVVEGENSNLKAERAVIKTIEARVSSENAKLLEERGKITAVVTSLQASLAEKDSQYLETKRNLIDTINGLEDRVTEWQSRYEDLTQETRAMLTRKDSDLKDYQQKADRLQSELLTTKESNIRLEASVAQNNASGVSTSVAADSAKRFAVQDIPETDDLAVRCSALESSLREMTEIARSSENALNSLTEANDQYRAHTESVLAKLREETEKARDAVEAARKEKDEAVNNYEKYREEHEKLFTESESKIKALESSQATFENTERALREDLKSQVEMAADEKTRYENEIQKLMAAQEDALALRNECTTLKAEVSSQSVTNAQLRTSLEKNEESWNTQKVALEQEIENLKQRLSESMSHNDALLNQIQEMTRLKESADSDGGLASGTADVLSYLRKEKEMIETNAMALQQEHTILKQRYEYVERSLEQTQLELKRLKEENSSSDQAHRSEQSQEQILRQLSEMNALGETNALLKSSNEFLTGQVKQFEEENSKLKEQIEPLESQLRDALAKLNVAEGRAKLAEEASERWKARATQQSAGANDEAEKLQLDLSNTQQELERCKSEVSNLQNQLSSLQSQLSQSNSAKEAAVKEASDSQHTLQKLREEFQIKLKKRSTQEKELRAEIESLEKEVKAAKESAASVVGPVTSESAVSSTSELEELRDKLQASIAQTSDVEKERDELKTKIAGLEQELETLRNKQPQNSSASATGGEELQKKISQLTSDNATLNSRLQTTVQFAEKRIEQTVAKSREDLEKAKQELAAKTEQLSKLESRNAELQAEVEKTQAKVEQARSNVKQEFELKNRLTNSRITKLSKDLEILRPENAAMRGMLNIPPGTPIAGVTYPSAPANAGNNASQLPRHVNNNKRAGAQDGGDAKRQLDNANFQKMRE